MSARHEALLAGFEPTFEFEPPPPVPFDTFAQRLRALRADAVGSDFDAILIHSDQVGWYHMSNSYLRYMCDWIREGLLIIPCDADLPATLLTFYGSGVLLPPPGDPTWVEDVRQIGGWGREVYARPGHPLPKVCDGARQVLDDLGLTRARLATIGDHTSKPYWARLRELAPHAQLEDRTEWVLRRQHVRTETEQALVRAAAQLIDIGVQAAQHVAAPGVSDHEIYAAFTYAQMLRGGETGDGYQIGVNKLGTHIGKPYGHVLADGDIVTLYISHVTYHGYDAQAARMLVVGDVSDEQERVMAMCVEGVERAMAVARPGLRFCDVNEAAFGPYVERGYLESADARVMPYSLEAGPDGAPLPFVRADIDDVALARQDRRLRHVYPPVRGPIGPSLGHSVSIPGAPGYTVISTNERVLEPGMTFVAHSQWYEPGVAGANVGNCLIVTEDGVENLNSHTQLAPHRIAS